MEELAGWEKIMLVREETLQGQLIALEARYLDIDSLKKGAF